MGDINVLTPKEDTPEYVRRAYGLTMEEFFECREQAQTILTHNPKLDPHEALRATVVEMLREWGIKDRNIIFGFMPLAYAAQDFLSEQQGVFAHQLGVPYEQWQRYILNEEAAPRDFLSSVEDYLEEYFSTLFN